MYMKSLALCLWYEASHVMGETGAGADWGRRVRCVCEVMSLADRLHLQTVVHDKMNANLYQTCKSRGYHLPICSGRNVLELPGTTESIEMAFSRVFVEVSSYHCTAHVYLTNYR